MNLPLRFEFLPATESGGVAAWVARRIPGCERGFGECAALRIYRAETIGAVLFHTWNPEAATICLSAAGGPGWLSRPVLYAMHSYGFNQIGCQAMLLQVAETNYRMRRIARAYGYREYVIPRLRGRNEAEAVMVLAEEDWRASKFHR